jgi:transcriptional repressor NrdR
MNCPRCAPEIGKTRVVENRKEEDRKERGPRVRRRRECLECGFRFTTLETVESGSVRSVGGRRVPFSSTRLLDSLEKLEGDKPSTHELKELVLSVEQRVEAQLESIDIDTLVGWVAGELPPSTRVAYLEVVQHLGAETAQRIAGGQVVKRGGQVVWFNRRKLHDSLAKAIHRLLSAGDLELLIDSVERRVIESRRPVSAGEIRSWVEERLWRLHPLAGIRYAAGAPDATLGKLLQRVTRVENGYVVKKHGGLEPFDRRKLARSVDLAFGKRSAKEALGRRIDRFADGLAKFVAESSEPIRTAEIGDRVLTWLKDNDEVAFVNYIGLYRDIKPHHLAEELCNWGIAP